jgi:acetyl-CoA carboxylase carboxyl transferase subunit alpha
MFLMATLPVPIVCVVIGEGGSGGALGIGVGDRVAVLENAYYSVISPEGCAGILWKSVDFKADAARALRIRSRDLKEFGVIDAVIEEPAGGAHRHPRQMAARLKTYLVRSLRELVSQPRDALVAARYEKFRAMGKFLEPEAADA